MGITLAKKLYNQKRDTIIKLWTIKLRETTIVEQNLIEALGYSMAKWDFIAKSPVEFLVDIYLPELNNLGLTGEFKILKEMISGCPLCNHIRGGDDSSTCDKCPLVSSPLRRCAEDNSPYSIFIDTVIHLRHLIGIGKYQGRKSRDREARKIATYIRDILYELYLDEMMREDSKACCKC